VEGQPAPSASSCTVLLIRLILAFAPSSRSPASSEPPDPIQPSTSARCAALSSSSIQAMRWGRSSLVHTPPLPRNHPPGMAEDGKTTLLTFLADRLLLLAFSMLSSRRSSLRESRATVGSLSFCWLTGMKSSGVPSTLHVLTLSCPLPHLFLSLTPLLLPPSSFLLSSRTMHHFFLPSQPMERESPSSPLYYFASISSGFSADAALPHPVSTQSKSPRWPSTSRPSMYRAGSRARPLRPPWNPDLILLVGRLL
jgi:hypothetical protein